MRHLTLDGGTGVRKFCIGHPPVRMELTRLVRLSSLTLRNFAWCAPVRHCGAHLQRGFR